MPSHTEKTGDQSGGPRISVVVATFNAADTLQGCVDSVAAQAHPETELLIADGGSTDGTLELLRRNEYKIARWESAPDRGIFDAWNKAVSWASGDWVCFLGADDRFFRDDVLERMVPRLAEAEARGVRVVYPRLAVVTAGGKLAETIGRPWGEIRDLYKQDAVVPHPGTMHHRGLFEEHGRFDESFRMAADYEFLLRELKSRDALFVPEVIGVAMRAGGVSSVPSHQLLNTREVARARRMNGITGFAPSLFRRRLRALAYVGIQRLIGPGRSERLADLYRVLKGKSKKWTA